jgi:hypothetical protein
VLEDAKDAADCILRCDEEVRWLGVAESDTWLDSAADVSEDSLLAERGVELRETLLRGVLANPCRRGCGTESEEHCDAERRGVL